MLALLAARTFDECAGFLPAASFASFRLELGLTYSRASLVLVLGAPGAMLANVSALLADHHSRRVIAACGAFGYALSLLAFALGQTFVALACASFTTGFFAHSLIIGTELALIDIAGADVTAYLARGMLFGTAGGRLGPVLRDPRVWYLGGVALLMGALQQPAGRLADRHGVRSGLAFFVALAIALALAALGGDAVTTRRAQASNARAI